MRHTLILIVMCMVLIAGCNDSDNQNNSSTFSVGEIGVSNGQPASAMQNYLDAIPYTSMESIGLTDGSNISALRSTVVADPVNDITVSLSGREILVRQVEPSSGTGPFNTVIYFHGGGFAVGSIHNNSISQQLADALGAKVFAVEYRLAPENKFPAGINDAKDITDWIVANADSYNARTSGIVLAGDSSGATFSIVTSIQKRDEGNSPIAGVVAFYPAVDFRSNSKSGGSWSDYASYKTLLTSDHEWFTSLYLSSSSQQIDPLVSPVLTSSLSGLPPHLVITAELDILRDEGEDFCRALNGEGVTVSCYRHNGMAHGYLSYSDVQVPYWNEAYSVLTQNKSLFWTQ